MNCPACSAAMQDGKLATVLHFGGEQLRLAARVTNGTRRANDVTNFKQKGANL